MATAGFLDIERTIAPPDFDRWRVPAATIAAHLALGQALAFGAFQEPLTRLLGGAASAPGDWTPKTLSWIVPVITIFLGLSAFVFGRWVEEAGPRRAMMAAATLLGSGLIASAVGVQLHALWLVFIGIGVLGGMGLGIGYLSPIPTLISWFPDRPALATGLTITGFGGGAMLGATLADASMRFFSDASASGVAESLIVMAIVSFALLSFAIATVRVPAAGWKPRSFTAKPIIVTGAGPVAPHIGSLAGRSIGERKEAAPDVRVDRAMRTPQFWLIWCVIFFSATGLLGFLALASPMVHDLFPYTVAAREAAGFLAILAMADVVGRLIWSISTDTVDRQPTYVIGLALATILVAVLPSLMTSGSRITLAVASALIVSAFGGIFASMPAALREIFGVMHIGSIQGRLLSAWSAAAVAGPLLANWLRDRELAAGATRVQAFALPMNALAGALALAFVANWVIYPVHPRHHHQPDGGFRA
jgi:MFS family permease